MVAYRESDIELVSQDGVKNRVRIVEPEQPCQYLVLCLPAMGVTSKQYHALARCLADQGLVAAAVDLRGHGHSSVRPSRDVNFSYAEMVQQDLPVAVNAVAQAFPHLKIILLGHSLGGQLASLYLAEQPGAVSGLVLAASCSVHYKGWPWPTSWSILLFSQIALLTARILGYFPGHRFKFGGNEARGVMRDWARNARTGKYQLSNSDTNYEDGMRRINVPVLAINFSDDRFAPVSATRALLRKFNDALNLSERRLRGDDLGTVKADHFNWLRFPDAVAQHVKQWLNSTYK